jgi:hypothetical protein
MYIPTMYLRVFQVGCFSTLQVCIQLSSGTCVLSAQPIRFLSLWSDNTVHVEERTFKLRNFSFCGFMSLFEFLLGSSSFLQNSVDAHTLARSLYSSVKAADKVPRPSDFGIFHF